MSGLMSAICISRMGRSRLGILREVRQLAGNVAYLPEDKETAAPWGGCLCQKTTRVSWDILPSFLMPIATQIPCEVRHRSCHDTRYTLHALGCGQARVGQHAAEYFFVQA